MTDRSATSEPARRTVVVGAACAALYIAVLSVTVAWHPGHARPLYDAFVPPSSYEFVDPPAFFASGNEKPGPVTVTIALDARGSAAAGVATPDGQFVIDLARGAVAPRSGARSVRVQVAPLAPGALPKVPVPLRANGNVYRVTMAYEPGGEPVERIAAAGTLLVELPEVGRQLYWSSGGHTWSPLAARPVASGALTLTATFRGPGDYVAATDLPELAAPPGHRSHVALVAGIATALGAALLFAGAWLVARRRLRGRVAS